MGEWIELKDLIGLAKLDAVDFETAQISRWGDEDDLEDCNVCRFRLNGTVYVVVEDPRDGYRSSMREVKVAPSAEFTELRSLRDKLGLELRRSSD